jgi:hypothetical protein
LRLAVWQTGLRVIQAFPVFGIGLGRYIYIVKSEPYRVPEQIIPVFHPHNSYLEIAALGGIPLALLFLVLLGDGCWLALRNWKRAAVFDRALFAGGLGLVASLSFNSLGNPGWTLTPLLTVGWLVLGGLASPFLVPARSQEAHEGRDVAINEESTEEVLDRERDEETGFSNAKSTGEMMLVEESDEEVNPSNAGSTEEMLVRENDLLEKHEGSQNDSSIREGEGAFSGDRGIPDEP